APVWLPAGVRLRDALPSNWSGAHACGVRLANLRLKELRMWARVARFEGDPGTVDAAIEEARAVAASGEVPPELAGAKVLMLVDRQSGGRLVGTMFDTEEAMRRGDAAMNAGQPRAGRRSSVELYEV